VRQRRCPAQRPKECGRRRFDESISKQAAWKEGSTVHEKSHDGF